MTKTEISLVEVGTNSKQVTEVDRDKLNVNSPRKEKQVGNMFATPASLITQVNQDDVGRQKEIAKTMETRAHEQEQSKQEHVSSEQSPTSNSSVIGYSCWFCCGSCTREEPQQIVQPADNSSEHEEDNKITEESNDHNEWAVETKIMEHEDEVEDEVDPKEEQYAIEISESDGDWLLPPIDPSDKGRKCLVLDLDETLVHSSFQPVESCTFRLPIELNGQEYKVYVNKRPFVDEFIAECSKYYELVVFTASLSEYANPVIDTLDKNRLIKHRLFRESCVFHEEQVYVKDLSRLGRNIKDCIIIDNSPFSYLYNPTNAIGCTSWFNDQSDTELRDLVPLLSGPLNDVNDVRTMLDARSQTCEWLINQYSSKKTNPLNLGSE